MKRTFNFLILVIAIFALGTIGCSKEDINEELPGGCMDVNSPHYNDAAVVDDESCQFLYVTDYELTNYEDIDWDVLINVDADVYIKVKKQSSSSWEFSSNVINDADPSTIQLWSAPYQFQLLNTTYVWELFDADIPPIDPDDAMSSGTFNPVTMGSNGVIVSQSIDGLTTVKIHYNLY